MGSSRVTIWQARSRFILSTRQASVVDLPLPAVPQKSIIPLVCSARAMTCGGMHRLCQSGILNATTRITAASEPR